MSSPELVFVLAEGQNAFFRELAEALLFEIRKLGGEGRVEIDSLPEPAPGLVTVLLPPHEFAALSVHPSALMLRRTVLISAEQPSSEFFGWNVEMAHHAGAVLDINPRAVRSYRDAGIEADHLQVGYSEAWDRRDDVAERDIDVLFMGRTTPRRTRALAHYADDLERLNCEFVLSDNTRPNVEEGVNFRAGESKLRLLSRAKVLLNVHGEGEPYFEWLRVAEAMSCGCAVVSEHSTDFAPLQVGKEVLAGRLETLGMLAAWLAEDDEERSRIVAAADARMREEANLGMGASALLEAARRADRNPADAQSIAAVTVLNGRIALRQTAPPPAPPALLDEGLSRGEQQVLRALKRQQQEILTFRRQLASEGLTRQRSERPRPETVELAATAGSQENAVPAVTVIVPLYNDEEVVTEALDSVAASTFTSWEIVVVDDASTDGGSDAVREWMDRHDSEAARLVRHEVNRGLAAARNTGGAWARGRLLMMLDSDNLLRPYGLARLVRALAKDPGAAFAYGILDRFLKEGPLDVVSNFGWEPWRFRGGNYIDAMALVRRSAFRKLGGYSEDARLLLGYEDYDFWVRLAEAGEWGAFVRQFVGSYRVGHSSMLSVTNISRIDALAAIAEHAPNLMSGVELQT